MKFWLSLLLVACAPALAQSPAPAPLASPAPENAASGEVWVGKFAPPVGSTWTLKMWNRARQSSTLVGSAKPSYELDQVTQVTADYDIISRDRFGATSIRVVYRDWEFRALSRSGDKAPIFSSVKAQDSKVPLEISFVIKQAPNGKVWNITGLERVQEQFRRLIQDAGSAIDPKKTGWVQAVAAPLLSQPEARNRFEEVLGTLPPSPVQIGESWNFSPQYPGGVPVERDVVGTRTLQGLDFSALIVDNARFSGVDTGGLQFKGDVFGRVQMDASSVRGVLEGRTRLERAGGLPLERTSNYREDGIVTLRTLNGQGAVEKQTATQLHLLQQGRTILRPRY